MNIKDAQRLLLATGYYKGGADGYNGELTMKAVAVIERTQAKQYPSSSIRKFWGNNRRLMAAGQAILNAYKFDAGAIDGIVGHNTTEAFRAWDFKNITGQKESVRRKALSGYKPPRAGRSIIPRQKDVEIYYGKAGKNSGTVRHQLTTIRLPFMLRIDYNLRQSTNKITVHKKAAPSLKAALLEVHAHYGIAKMRELGIDRFAGGYNPRKMRGGSKWSMHAYGCAVDFYAKPNGLRMSCPQALFCRPEYKPFLDIMEKHGWFPALRLWGKDAMHFQRALM